MKILSLIFILVCAVLTTLANLLLRHGLLKSGGLSIRPGDWLAGWVSTVSQPAFTLGIVFYGLAAIVWFYALSITEVSSGYPVLVGLTFVLVTLGAVVVFQEPVSLLKGIGVLTILAGVVLIARCS